MPTLPSEKLLGGADDEADDEGALAFDEEQPAPFCAMPASCRSGKGSSDCGSTSNSAAGSAALERARAQNSSKARSGKLKAPADEMPSPAEAKRSSLESRRVSFDITI